MANPANDMGAAGTVELRLTYPLYTDVCTRYTMVGYALRLGDLGTLGAELDSALRRLLRVMRSQEITFFVDEHTWQGLRQRLVGAGSTRVAAVSRSSFTVEKDFQVMDGRDVGLPLFRTRSTLVTVDESLARSVPLAAEFSAKLLSELAAQQAAPARASGLLPARPDGAFRWRLVVRWIEMDSMGHVNQSQYGSWMEEARAVAHATGGYGGAAGEASALPPKRLLIDYVGQAVAGDEVSVFTWWDGEAFSFEVLCDRRAAAAPGAGAASAASAARASNAGSAGPDVLTRGRMWTSGPGAAAARL